MNFKNISDRVLLEKTESLVQQERELLTQILHHLREIESRRLFSSLGFSSLFDYAVRRLKYSEDQAARRIAAMRLLKELPEIEEKIETGALTLTNLGMAQTLFRHDHKKSIQNIKDGSLTTSCLSRTAKLSFLAKLENKSKRQAEKIVLEQTGDPGALKPDRMKVVTESKVEIQFIADQTLLDKIEKLKGLLAHSHPQISMAELLDKLCDLGLKKFDPTMKVKNESKPKTVHDREYAAQESLPAPARVERDTALKPEVRADLTHHKRSNISSAVRQEVWFKAKGQCQNCGSKHALQIDHVRPVALGGGNHLENLRLLCRSCNQRAAIQVFGQDKMTTFLKL